jgi:hypothetical protein
MRELDPAGAGAEIGIVQSLDLFEMFRHGRIDSRGQHRAPIARTLSAADDDLVSRQVDILDEQPAALEETKTGAVQ